MLTQKDVLKKVGKRPQTALTIAQKFGRDSGRAVSRILADLAKEGSVTKTEKGWAKTV
jgi:hypothetical protein